MMQSMPAVPDADVSTLWSHWRTPPAMQSRAGSILIIDGLLTRDSLMTPENRRVQRFAKRLAVVVRDIDLYSINLSASGMQIAVPAMEMFEFTADLDARLMNATITLPDHQRITATCQVAYVSQYGDGYLIGMHFKNFLDDGLNQLLRFIEYDAGPQYLPAPRRNQPASLSS